MTPAMSSNQTTNHGHHHGTTTVATKDAALLMMETMDASATMGLHRSNLMRLQVTELLQECHIPELAQTSWALDSHEYLVQLTDLVQQLPSFQYSSTAAASSSSSSKRLLFQHRSDKPIVVNYDGAVPPSSSTNDKNNTSNAATTTTSPKNHHHHSSSAANRRLVVEPIGCTKTPVAWTKATGNAKLLPTFTLMVQLPTSMFATKDYLNYRYMDVSVAVVPFSVIAFPRSPLCILCCFFVFVWLLFCRFCIRCLMSEYFPSFFFYSRSLDQYNIHV
jgi:hypothetical protein